MFLGCLIALLFGLGNVTADGVEICKVDLSCPGQPATKKGADWSDFEVSGGCDGDRHDPRYWTDPVSNLSFGCGQPGGHGNVIAGGGDPICNSAYQQWEGDPAPMMLRIYGTGHTAGDYTIEVLHAWNGGSISGLSVSGASSHTIIQPGQVVNTGSDADLLAAVGSHTLVEYSIDTDGQSVTLEWSGTPKINAWILNAEIQVEELDFGDAPDPTYPTMLANDGARHVIGPVGTMGVYLGSGVDADPDGQPDLSATGDDNDGNDDEDGITFTSALIPGQTTTIDVNASTDGYLDAWVDFDGNGGWGEADNQIFASQPVPQGVSPLSFTVPAAAMPGTTFARFRFSLNGGLSYIGQAPDGEVEDYIVRIKEAPKPPVPNLKWSQPPIEIDPTSPRPRYCGWDELSLEWSPTLWKVVADDYRCLGHMPVSSVHWWGSHYGWIENVPPDPQPVAWQIGFWSNVPPGPGGDPPFSRPGELLWLIKVSADRVRVEWAGVDNHPYPEYPPDTCFQYYVDLEPKEYFWQDYFGAHDNIYWVSIVALYPVDINIRYPWGRKTRPWSWMDDAVTFELPGPPVQGMVVDPRIVNPLVDPVFEESVDVAFELDTEPNWVKWEQPFTGNRRWPHYEDEMSMAWDDGSGALTIGRLVADDWPCDQNTPITAIVWWGSYIGYRYQACSTAMMAPPVKPNYFLLQIWSDVPAGVDTPYSHPGRVLWKYRAADYDEVLVGYDKHPALMIGPPREPVFRYSVRLPRDVWFKQEAAEGIYWLSVTAVYGPGTDPTYDWGWTNHRYVAKDDAVAGYVNPADPEPVWTWEELFDQTGESEDMSFILFTLDWPKCWGYLTQCHGDADNTGDVKGSDFLALKNSWYKVYPDPLYDPCADFDRNGEVKGSDFLILKTYWYTSPPPDCPRGGKWPP
jgi:hypothetical protein